MTHHPTRRRRALAAGLTTTLLVATAACTSDTPQAEEGATAPSQSAGAATTLEAKPVPWKLRSRSIGERPLPRRRVAVIERQVGAVITSYVDEAFLGAYPRQSFRGAFDHFTGNAAVQARQDRDLVTNAAVGAEVEAVAPLVKRARLEMLVHRGVVAGLTARVRVVFRMEREDGTARRVTVAGRLLMNRNRRGAWQIFGYDLARAAVPAGKGASS